MICNVLNHSQKKKIITNIISPYPCKTCAKHRAKLDACLLSVCKRGQQGICMESVEAWVTSTHTSDISDFFSFKKRENTANK